MMGRMLNRRGFGDPVIENGARLGDMKVHFYRTLDKVVPRLAINVIVSGLQGL